MYRPTTSSTTINDGKDRDQDRNLVLCQILNELKKINLQFSLMTDTEIKNKEVG